jgi:uncharacterized membrane protein YbaN (DUF454 family)
MTSKPVSTARKVFDWTLGSLLLVIGVIGLFLPILQGWFFILAGLAVLSSHSRWAHAINERIRGAGRKVRERIQQRRARAAASNPHGPDGPAEGT